MTVVDTTDRSQTESITFEFDLSHSPQKVWRALTDPKLLTEWLLPVVGLELAPGAEFTFKAPPQPEWDGIVNCRFLEIEPRKKLRLGVGRWRHRYGRHLHPQSYRLGHATVAGAVRLQARSEEELRRRALRLEDDGWKAGRSAPADRLN